MELVVKTADFVVIHRQNGGGEIGAVAQLTRVLIYFRKYINKTSL